MLIKLKPNTPGQRGTVLVSKKHLSKEAPFKSLTKPITSYAFIPYSFGHQYIDKIIINGKVQS